MVSINGRPVCVDASVVVPIVVFEEQSTVAQRFWGELIDQKVEIIAPPLINYEIVAAIYRKAYRRLITWDEAFDSIKLALDLGITIVNFKGLHNRAFEIAKEFGRPTTYDAHYLAVAEHFKAPFWTADERLFNSVKDKFSWIRLLKDYEEKLG